MDKRRIRRTTVELGKDILILLLTCSALWMLSRGGLFQSLELGREPSGQISGLQDSSADLTRAASPLRITVTLRSEGEVERCSLQYDEDAADALFRRAAGLLMETLSSAEAPERVRESEWRQALAGAPGFCFDFQGEMPLSVLTGWLGGELSIPDAAVRRLVLTARGDGAALYYYDLNAGVWCRCTTQVVSAVQLENALEGLSDDGAYYAFESETAGIMDPDTMLAPDVGEMRVCLAENPVSGGQSALEGLMEDLGINLSGSVFYSAAGDEVVRSGSDTLRLSKDGVVEYTGAEGGQGHFPMDRIAGESEVFCAVESCRRLLEQAVTPRCGLARLYLDAVEQTETGWKVRFEYRLNAVPVSLHTGPAAEFEISGGSITAFTLRLRRYTESEQEQLILPPIQAAAAMGALSLSGQELMVLYHDVGDDQVVPEWTAVLR